MINLEKVSGLPIKYNKKLISKKLKLPKPNIRKLKQMKKVLFSKVKGDKNLYYMYRGIGKNKKLRYDITVIPPNKLGEEYVKTLGHYHEKVPKTKLTYPEIYEVLNGKTLYLLQKKPLKEVLIIEAKKGDKVIIPPNYGHITINPTNKVLIMANVVSTKFKSKYKEITNKKGGAYYGLADKKKIKFVKNKNYKNLPKLQKRKAKKHSRLKKPLYKILIEEPEKLKFLNNPRGVKL